VGAAQTFGRYCEKPYPVLLSERLGLPSLNFGCAGAGPEFFLRDEPLIRFLNRSRFVILQVMSARGQSNSHYDCRGLSVCQVRRDGRRMGVEAYFDELMAGHPALQQLPGPARVRRKIGNLSARPRTRALVNEIRAAWIESSIAFLRRLEVPVVLFWFSKRPPDYRENYATRWKLFGELPHLVNASMMTQVRPHASAYVECVSSRGSPQKLHSRFTGELVSGPVSENERYPSPEMHEDAAQALHETCVRML
jgi:hypothetical protein